MSGESRKRTFMVTGSSSGIGRAVAERLLDGGHRVVGLARNHEKFSPNSSEYIKETVDLTVPEQLASTVERILKRFPELDGVVSNAGVGTMGTLEQFSYSQIERAISVNLLSHLYIARAVIPFFRRGGAGDLVFMGSEASKRGAQKGSLYCAAKFGLRGLAQSLREECGRSGVRVMAVYPGMVRTPFFDELAFQPGPADENAIRPGDVARVVEMMFNLPVGTVVDEVDLSPLKKVIAPNNSR